MGKKTDSQPDGDLRIGRHWRSREEDKAMVKAGDSSVIPAYDLMSQFRGGVEAERIASLPEKCDQGCVYNLVRLRFMIIL